jgi:Family of unknown function (DUF6328)
VAPQHDERDETATERADRNLTELLQELRVALPGVQVLFAFLLAVPFQQRFGDVTDFQRDVYFGTLLCSAVATALLIAPTAYHRLNFRRSDKTHIVDVSSRLTISGLGMLALAMVGAVMLVTDVLFGTTTVIVTTVAVALVFTVFWFAAPLARRRVTERRAPDV